MLDDSRATARRITEETMEEDNGSERRRYFRIEDEVILFFREVSHEDVPEYGAFQEQDLDAFSLSSKMDLLTAESRPVLRRIEREYPEVGAFLRIIEQKVDLVAQAVLARETELLEQPTRRVSLSASGIAFENDQPFHVGKVLELKMVLPPTLAGVLAYGNVVYCRHMGGDNSAYHVAVDFIGLRERDRELLIRHVVKRQLRQLRDRNQESG